MTAPLDEVTLSRLCAVAWTVRECAILIGQTKVGCAVLGVNGSVYGGCNIEQRFRSHDIHAEVNALGNMAAAGVKTCVAVLIVAERVKFTPCGACMDWIMQFGGPDCIVAFQSKV